MKKYITSIACIAVLFILFANCKHVDILYRFRIKGEVISNHSLKNNVRIYFIDAGLKNGAKGLDKYKKEVGAIDKSGIVDIKYEYFAGHDDFLFFHNTTGKIIIFVMNGENTIFRKEYNTNNLPHDSLGYYMLIDIGEIDIQ